MKNLLISITCFFCTILFAQENEQIAPKDYTVTIDSLFRFVKKDQMKTSLLYDRVVANASLLDFNNRESEQKSSYWHYIQALSEIHRSSLEPRNVMQYEIIDDLRAKNDNVLNISFINTTVDYVDYGSKEAPTLVFKDGFFYNIDDRNPFKQKQVTVVAAIAENIVYKDVKIRLNPDLMYQDDSNPIKNLTAIINGTEIKLVSNFENSKELTDYRFKGDEKEIIFNVQFKDDSAIQTVATINVSLPQNIATSATTFPLEENFTDNLGIDRNSSENTIPFQGYNETAPIHGILEYRTYYNTVTNDGALKSKINKPVIILDGFDPGDKRKIYQGSVGYDSNSQSLYQSMFFDHDNNLTTPKKNFVDFTLRPQGFDVTLVNFPENKIVHPTQPTRPVWVITNVIAHITHMPWPFQSMTITTYEEIGHWTTVVNYLHLADGGADYIERNAMALVALLKRENKKLSDNGSSEKITLIGPSMGGLISRYALAYMEKNNISHNVKLWASFDSPHLGANIPIAAQENIYFFAQFGQKEQAKRKFHENFASPAARQMLIEQLDYKHQNYEWHQNPKIWILESFPIQYNSAFLGQNNTSPFRARFMNELENLNGIPNSKGFPTNVRKIALINGTTNGAKTNSEGELVLELAGFLPSWNKAVAFENRNLATSGNWSQTFSGKVTIPSSASDFEIFLGALLGGPIGALLVANVPDAINCATTNRPNLNPRGSMDVVQGGTFNTQKIIKDEFAPQLDEAGVEQQWRRVRNNHSFIPSVSSLAFKNSNFDWTLPLNRNLLCDPNNKEIYFDSYFSPSKNEEHVALTNESVEWLLKEINGNPQVPWFDVDKDKLVGLAHLCNNQTANYAFQNDVCKLPSAVVTWVLTPNLELLYSDGFSISVKSIESGAATITAIFANGMKVIKPIWLGAPVFKYFTSDDPSGNVMCIAPIDLLTVELPSQSVVAVFDGQTNTEIQTNTNWEWIRDNNLIWLNGIRNKRNICPMAIGTSSFRVRAKNACGWSDWGEMPSFEITAAPTFNQRTANLNFYTVFPNPAKNIVNIELRNKDNQPIDKAKITASLFNMMGVLQRDVTIKNNIATIDVSDMVRGLYLLKIDIDGSVETHHISLE